MHIFSYSQLSIWSSILVLREVCVDGMGVWDEMRCVDAEASLDGELHTVLIYGGMS